jgi:hypothetical protein
MLEIEKSFWVERNIKPYVFVALESHRRAECVAFAQDIGATGVYVSRYRGFTEDSLDCLADLGFASALFLHGRARIFGRIPSPEPV